MKNILLLIFIFSITSCQKETNEIDPDLYSIVFCKEIVINTADAINFRLVGKWKWFKQICFPNLEQDLKSNLGLTVEFMSDSTFKVLKDEMPYMNGTWKLQADTDGLRIITLPIVNELTGKFNMCDNKFVCNDIGSDKCANFFRRQ